MITIDGIEYEIVWRCCVCKNIQLKENQLPSDGYHKECFINFMTKDGFFSDHDIAEMVNEMSFPNG